MVWSKGGSFSLDMILVTNSLENQEVLPHAPRQFVLRIRRAFISMRILIISHKKIILKTSKFGWFWTKNTLIFNFTLLRAFNCRFSFLPLKCNFAVVLFRGRVFFSIWRKKNLPPQIFWKITTVQFFCVILALF